MKPSVSLAVAAVAMVTGLASHAPRAWAFEPAPASGPTSTVVFTGGDVANSSFAFHAGAIRALNGDLGKEGVMLRALGVYVDYEYDTFLPFPTRRGIDGDAGIFDLMLGYQFLGPGHRAAIYVGGEYQNHDLSPNDPSNDVNGTEWGFKVSGEFETNETSRLYVGLIGSYSTAYETYWSRARVGARVDRYVLGVEGLLHGNEGYDAERLGGFVNIPLGFNYGTLSVSAGYQWADEDSSGFGGGSGAYGSAGVSFAF